MKVEKRMDKYRTFPIRCNDFIHIQSEKHQIRMLSIPRDILVIYLKLVITIKLHMRMLMVAQLFQWIPVEATMNVPVDYYVRVNMKAFEAVDELGGIYYDVPYNLNEPNSDDTGRIKIKRLSKT